MRLILVVLLIIIGRAALHAQLPYFNRVDTFSGFAKTFGSIYSYDNKVLITHAYAKFTPAYNEVTVVHLYDYEGNLILNKKFILDSSISTSRLKFAKSSNNFLYMGFSIADLTDTVNDTQNRYYALAKLDDNLDTLWVKYYDRPTIYYEFVQGITALHDGLLLFGSVRDSTINTFNNYHVMKTDFDGNMLWHHTYPETAIARHGLYLKAIELPDRSIRIMGQNYQYYDATFDRLDSMGNKIYHRVYFNDYNDYPTDMIPCKEGGYVIVGFHDTEHLGLVADSFRMSIMKMNSVGTLQWKKSIELGDNVGINGIVQNDDSTYTISYAYVDYSDGIEEFKTGIRKFDVNFNELWDRKIKPISGDHAEALIFHGSQGGYIFAAKDINLDPWICYVDKCGYQTPDSGCVISAIEEQAQLEASVILYPNPAATQLTLYWDGTEPARISIYNTLGQLVLTQAITYANTSFDISRLATGIYTLQLIDAKGRSAVRKWVKE